MTIDKPDTNETNLKWEPGLDGAEALICPNGECLGSIWHQKPIGEEWRFSTLGVRSSKETFASSAQAKAALIERLISEGRIRESLRETLMR